MKIYYLKFRAPKVKDFISFCRLYHISVYLTWLSEDFFSDKFFHATITDEPDAKITTEEKARLIAENWASFVQNTEELK
jgi:hypothetical protein